jgi:hypothetical protein
VIGFLSDEHHERLWRICDTLVSGAGARAAMICDTSNGEVLVSVGDTSATGAVSGVDALGPGEQLVRGEAGQIYAVDVPGGALLAVLHEVGALDGVRALAAEAVHDTAELLASLAPRYQASGLGPQASGPRNQASGLRPQASGSRNASSAPSRKFTTRKKPAPKRKPAATKKPAPKRKPVAKRKPASRKKKGLGRRLRPSRKRRR